MGYKKKGVEGLFETIWSIALNKALPKDISYKCRVLASQTLGSVRWS